MYACAPGDFEKQSAILLGCNELLPYHPQALVDVVGALVDRIPLIGMVVDEEQRRQLVTLLCDWGLPAHLMHFVSMPVKGMWVRDYGPGFVRTPDAGITILDADYLELDRHVDDKAPTELANLLRVPVVQVPITLEGGNILSNGQGLCITTSTLVSRNLKRGYDEAAVRNLLRKFYGFDQVAVLHPLMAEATGHVDMFATFVAPNVVVIGEYDPAIDPVNADVVNYNARILAGVQTRWGPLQVVRIPMPSNRGSVWRTYTNVIYANDVMLMPAYPGVDQDKQAKARQIFADLLPGWNIVEIDTTTVIRQRGALRCVSINIPWLEDRFAMPERWSASARELATA
jgi:agmatine/peptidylarginine deiminase